MPGTEEWSVLPPNLLDAAAKTIFDREPTEEEVARVRVLFNTWQRTGVISVPTSTRNVLCGVSVAEAAANIERAGRIIRGER